MINKRKDEVLRQLAVCESGDHGDSAVPVIGGRGAYLGRFQFAPRTVIDVGVEAGTPELYRAFPDADLLLVEPMEEWRDHLYRLGTLQGGLAT